MAIIIALIILGIILISFEFLVPGGVLGFLGGVAIFAACGVAYHFYGPSGAGWIFAASLILVTVVVYFEFRLLPKTQLGKKVFLKTSTGGTAGTGVGSPPPGNLVGEKGQTLTTLAPSGQVVIAGATYQAYSEDGLLPKGIAVEVIEHNSFRLKVRRSA